MRNVDLSTSHFIDFDIRKQAARMTQRVPPAAVGNRSTGKWSMLINPKCSIAFINGLTAFEERKVVRKTR